jgi:lysophospholipase L1-like esterase
MNPRRKMVDVAILLVACLLALGVSEIALRLLIPDTEQYYVHRPGSGTVFLPDTSIIRGVQGPSQFRINNQGVRGRHLDPQVDEYRILTIGGSTTELLLMDEPRTWPAMVEQSLLETGAEGRRAWVGNVGKSGANARDHVLHTRYLLDQFPQIDAVIVLVGVNDLTLALAEGETYIRLPSLDEPEAKAAQLERAFSVRPGSISQPIYSGVHPWFKRTALYQVASRARMKIRGQLAASGAVQDRVGESVARWRSHRSASQGRLTELPDLGPALGRYRAYLESIADEAEARGVRLIYMTQPALWRANLSQGEEELLWMGGDAPDFMEGPGARYYTAEALAAAMQAFNQVTLELCRSRGVECIDLAAGLPRTTEVFYDDVHFTDEGSRRVAEIVTGHLQANPPFGDAGRP